MKRVSWMEHVGLQWCPNSCIQLQTLAKNLYTWTLDEAASPGIELGLLSIHAIKVGVPYHMNSHSVI